MELLMLNSKTLNLLTVFKEMSSDSFKNCYRQTIRLQIIYFDMYKRDLELSNRKTQPTIYANIDVKLYRIPEPLGIK